MPNNSLAEFISQPAARRPILLEGKWLGDSGGKSWAAANPSSILEGSREALEELPAWVDRQARRYPDGAAVGYLSYELARHFERLELPTVRSLPDLSFAYYPRIGPVGGDQPLRQAPLTPIDSNFDVEGYRRAVRRIRRYIEAGDVYQANLTIQFRADLRSDAPEAIYRRIRSSHAPFRAFLKTPERTIISNSPERFFQAQGRHILTSPIKGTVAHNSQDPESRDRPASLECQGPRREPDDRGPAAQ